MKVEPSGVVMIGECSIQTQVCQAVQPAPITAVWSSPGRVQIDVCRACLEEMIRDGEWEVEGARVPKRFDVAVYNPSDKLQLVVEVKSRIPSAFRDDKQWALQVHRNLITHAAIPLSPYFLLVHDATRFYLWKQDFQANLLRMPDYEYEGGDLLAPYMCSENAETILPEARQQSIAVVAWLQTLISMAEPPANAAIEWVITSGLFDAMRYGKVISEALVQTTSSRRHVVAAHI